MLFSDARLAKRTFVITIVATDEDGIPNPNICVYEEMPGFCEESGEYVTVDDETYIAVLLEAVPYIRSRVRLLLAEREDTGKAGLP